MSRVLALLRACLTAGFAFLYLFLVGTPFVLHAWWMRRIDRLYRAAWWGASLSLRLAGVRYRVSGEENLPCGRPCVYMANHQSYVDPPLLFVLLPPRLAMMGKKSLFSIPVLGRVLDLGDFVPVHRENPEGARAAVEEALPRLERGISFLVFPEGTRSPDGRLLEFKRGGFILALRAGAPIVPITIDGAAAVMPRNRWEIRPGLVRVTIHPPVETHQRSLEERRQIADEVRTIIGSVLPVEQQGNAGERAARVAAQDDSF